MVKKTPLAKKTRRAALQFVHRYDEYIKKRIEDKMNENEGGSVLTPSPQSNVYTIRASAIGTCRRKLWYNFRRPRPVEDTSYLQRMWVGTILHEAMEELTAIMDSSEEDVCVLHLDDKQFQETLIKKDAKGCTLLLQGTPDVVLLWKDKEGLPKKGGSFSRGWKVILDFKGLSRYNMDNFFAGSDLVKHYIYQLQAYLLLTKADFALIVARSKETGETLYKPVFPNTKRLAIWGKLFLKAMRLKHRPPNRDFHEKTGECMFCPWKEECWGTLDTNVKTDPSLTKQEESRFSKWLQQYTTSQIAEEEAAKKKMEVKRLLRNLHDKKQARRFTVDGVGRSTLYTTVRHTKRIKKSEEDRLIQEGVIEIVPSESTSLRVSVSRED